MKKNQKVINKRGGFRMNAMWISLLWTVSSAIIYGVLLMLRSNGLELLNQYLYHILLGMIYIGGFLSLMFFLRKKITHGYFRRMATILCIVCVTTVGTTVFQRLAYLPYHYSTMENAGNKVAVMCHMMVDPEISDRLNAASAAYMAEAEAEAAAAVAAGESFEEVPNTVVGMDLLSTYSAYPIKHKYFYDANANVDGLVYTLFGATSVDLKVEWPEDNVCHLYAIGAEAEGESFTYLK